MRLLPYTTFSFDVMGSLDNTVDKMDRSIHPRQSFWLLGFGRRNEGFEGKVSEASFELNRIIGYRNSFLPHAYGRFEQVNRHRTTVHVTVTLHPFVILFCLVWCGSIGYGLLNAIIEGNSNSISLLSGALLFVYVLVMVGWSAEIGKLRRFIRGVYPNVYRTE